MYRFMRTATVKNASALVGGLKFAAEVSAHFGKKYSVDMKHGVEIFGKHTNSLAFRIPQRRYDDRAECEAYAG